MYIPAVFINPILSFTFIPEVGVRLSCLFLSKESFEDRLRSSLENERNFFEKLKMEKENEILESGGDPFFLTEDLIYEKEPEGDSDYNEQFNFGFASIGGGNSNIISSKSSDESQVTPLDQYVWNGEEDESAYFD